MNQSRAVPHLVLGLLTLLAVLAIFLSLDTAPPNAEQQLKVAAGNTAGAASFVLTDTITVLPTGTAAAGGPRTETAVITYQAPDRVREVVSANGRTITVLAIGPDRYERSGTAKWVSLGASPGSVPAGQQAAEGVLGPIRAVGTPTGVVAHGEQFTFVPEQESLLLADLLGSASGRLSPTQATFTATVSGEFLTLLRLDAVAPGGRIAVRLALSQFDRVAPIEPPAGVATPGAAG